MSVGIAMTDDPDLGGEQLLHRADLAMYEAKSRSGLPVALHDAAVAQQASARQALISRLQQAIALDQPQREGLALHYRPIVSLQDGRLQGYEAQLRLEPPDCEQAPFPMADFLASVERSGLSLPLGRWLRRTALAQLQEWDRHTPALTLALPISASELAGRRLCHGLATQAAAAHLDPARLVLTVAEPLLLDPSADLCAELQALSALGVKLVLDHFGAGPSNLATLCQLPLEAIRCDLPELQGPQQQRHGRRAALLPAAIRLVRDLGLEVIADGITHEHQPGELQQLGVRWGQGPLYGPALS